MTKERFVVVGSFLDGDNVFKSYGVSRSNECSDQPDNGSFLCRFNIASLINLCSEGLEKDGPF